MWWLTVALVCSLFVQLPDATFVRFKQSWLQSQIGITLLSRREDDDADDHLQELYTRLTERLRTHTDRIARIWTVYALYAMYECQTHRPRKKRIILPQYLWSTLEECVTEFLHLSPRDPIHVLRSLIDRDCFEAHCEPPRRVVEREEAQEEREEEEEKEQEQGEGKTKAEEEIMRKTRSVAQKRSVEARRSGWRRIQRSGKFAVASDQIAYSERFVMF